MSLKTFHIIFVTMAVVLCLVFGGWCLNSDFAKGRPGYAITGYVSFVFAALLVLYEIVFLKKLKEKK
jgi:hypothetical protein